jgi:hypothetical protein
VGDEERNGNFLDDAVQADLRGEVDEFREGSLSPDPDDVVPVVRYWPFALALESPALDRAPVVVATPGDDEPEPFLERGGAPGVVPAERPADQPDRGRIYVIPGQRLVDARGSPCLGVDACGQALQAGAWLKYAGRVVPW